MDEDDVQEDHKDEYYDDDYDNEATWRYDDEIADTPAKKTVPFDVSVDKESAQGWYDIADQLAKDTIEMEEEDPFEDPEVQEFLEKADEPGPWSEEDDKIHTVGGLTNDKESGFMDFQDKMDENDAAREINVIDPEEVSKKFEVENTQGDVTVVDETETEADRIGTFPNENNPTSVAATVEKVKNEFGTYPETVEKIETPHLPKEEITTTTTLPPEARGVKPPAIEKEEEVENMKRDFLEEVDEDELFKQAMRAKAEEDMKDFLKNKEDGDKQD